MPKKQIRAQQARQLALTNEAVPAEAERPTSTRSADAARSFAVDVARMAEADHCDDILILDLRGVSPVCDLFVIATGTSDRQMRAVADHIEEMGKPRDERPYGIAGYDEGRWIILDYVDVVVHLFDAEARAYYDLETLWGDSPKVEWST